MAKASNNEFPSVLFAEQGSDPTTPAAGTWRVYIKSTGLFLIDDAGTVIGPLGAGSMATDTLWDAAGDLAVGTGANTGGRIAMGTALQVLRVNAAGTALEWAAASGGGSSVPNARVAANSAGLTTATTAYTANDQLGTIIELTGAVSSSGGFATIVGATLLDKSAIVGAVSCYLFDRSVTLASDNAAADFSDSDMENLVGIIEFPPPTYAKTASPSNGLAQIEPLALPVKSNATSLWAALVTRTGHTFFGAATDLRLTLTLEQ